MDLFESEFAGYLQTSNRTPRHTGRAKLTAIKVASRALALTQIAARRQCIEFIARRCAPQALAGLFSHSRDGMPGDVARSPGQKRESIVLFALPTRRQK